MLTSTIRVIKFSFQDFFRNFWLSFVTLTILVLSLFTVNLLIIFNLIATSSIDTVEDKIDVTVYFKADLKEEQIFNVQRYLEALDEVKEVQYISKDQALEDFREDHEDQPNILESLQELDENPLGASLVIKAESTYDYPSILENLDDPQYDNLIEDKEIEDHRQVIDKITNITQRVNTAVIIVVIIFTLISLSIIFNAIRMAIYTHRDEIVAMKLVGATNWFVRAPFLLQGIIFAALSLILTLIIIYPILGFIQPYIHSFLENDFNIINYFNNNFLLIFGAQFLGAIVINLLSSYWAINRYLKV